MRSGIVFLVEPRRVHELDLPFQPKA